MVAFHYYKQVAMPVYKQEVWKYAIAWHNVSKNLYVLQTGQEVSFQIRIVWHDTRNTEVC